jgi:hypothetical protein
VSLDDPRGANERRADDRPERKINRITLTEFIEPAERSRCADNDVEQNRSENVGIVRAKSE